MGVSDKLFRDKMTANINSIDQRYQRKLRAGASPEELAAIQQEKKDAEAKLDYANRAWNAAKETGKQLSDGFYNSLANSVTTRQDFKNMMTGGPTGNQYDVRAATTRENARLYGNEAANRGMEAQQSQQIAERNAFGEAGKQASMQNQAENKQAVQNLSAAAGTSAALSRKTNTPDVKYQEGRQDTARQRAAESRKEADIARQDAANMYGASDEYKISSRDYNWYRDEADRLALAKDEERTPPPQEPPAPEQPPAETPAETPAEPEPEPELGEGGRQNILNYLSNSTVRRTVSASNPKVAKGWKVTQGADGNISVAPYPAKNIGDITQYTDIPDYTPADEEKLKAVAAKHPEYARQEGESENAWTERINKEWRGGNLGTKAFNESQGQVQQLAVGTDNAQPGMALVGEQGPELVMMNGGEQVIPNGQTEQYLAQNGLQAPVMSPAERALSDFRMKCIKEDLERDGNLDAKTWMWLAKQQGGKFQHNGKDYDFFDESDWDDEDSVLDGYAEHIKNYVYTYKPEAQEIDPDIDPNQEHIGPMAQDIEKVNPACIQETPEGVKTVDTARLAMMNAGAIGDLARRLVEIEARLG